MKKLKTLMAAVIALLATSTITAQTAEMFQPYKSNAMRLPSVPLLVNDPYFSFWSPFDKLTDGSVRHWTDAEKPIEGLLRVDGKSYRWMGNGLSILLNPIAPMSDAENSWTGRVSHTKQNNTNWTSRSFNDSNWKEKAGLGHKGRISQCEQLVDRHQQ